MTRGVWTLDDFLAVRPRIIWIVRTQERETCEGVHVGVYLAPADGSRLTARNRGERLYVRVEPAELARIQSRLSVYFESAAIPHRKRMWNEFPPAETAAA